MAVLVVLFGVVVALLGLLVAGLLRSHAEILRALHELGVDLDPARADTVSTAVGAPTVRAGSEKRARQRAQGVRSGEVPMRPSREAVDIVGQTPDQAAVSISVIGRPGLTLLAFLSTGCGTCHFFWDAFADPSLAIPGDARLVTVTKGADAEQPAMVRKLAPASVPLVMSSDAWDAYDVPVEGASGTVVGEGAAGTWDQVTALLHSALDDAGLLDRKGRVKTGLQPRARADALREARVDQELLAAGLQPGDPSLYVLPDDERPDDERDAGTAEPGNRG
jgi:hypothetical protein